MPIDKTKKDRVRANCPNEEVLFLQLESNYENTSVADVVGRLVTKHLTLITTDLTRLDPRKFLGRQVKDQMDNLDFRWALNDLKNILENEMDPSTYYESLNSLILEAKGERVANPIHYQFPEHVRDLFFHKKSTAPKEHKMAVKSPPNNYIVVSLGKENNKSETLRKSGERNIRYDHIEAIGPEGTRQTVEELEKAAPKARMNLRWELRDFFCRIEDPDGNDVTEDYAAPENRPTWDPEAKAKRAEAKAEREAKKAEKAAAKQASGSKSPSSGTLPAESDNWIQPPPEHEDHPDDVEDCVLHLMEQGMPEEVARQVVRDNGVNNTYEAYPREESGEEVEGDGSEVTEDGVEGLA